MSRAKKELIGALVECARMIINRRVPLTDAQLNALRREASSLSELVRPSNGLEGRRRVLQRGGFLGALLGPIVSSVLPAVLGSALGGGGAPRRRY